MLQDMAVLTGGQVIAEEVGLKLDNTTLDLLGSARKVVIDQGQHHHHRGCRHPRGRQRSHRPDQGRDRQHRLRLGPREAPGASRQAHAAVSPSSRSALPPRWSSRRRSTASRMRCRATRAAIEEGIVAGGGTALVRAKSAVSSVGRQARGRRADRCPHRAARPRRSGPADRRQRRSSKVPSSSSSSSRRPATPASTPRPASSTDLLAGRRHRPGEGDPCGAAERSVDRGAAAHHRVPRRRQARGGRRRWRWHARHGRHGWHGRHDVILPSGR